MQDRQLSTENVAQTQPPSAHSCLTGFLVAMLFSFVGLMGFLWVGTITEDLFGTGRVNNV